MFDLNNPDALLEVWTTLNNALAGITDEEVVWKLLDRELATRRRGAVALRLHQRYNRLRADRERAEIIRWTGHRTGAAARAELMEVE